MTHFWITLANLAIFAVVGLVYFIPSYIAARRKHRSATALLAVNVFAGWTVAGWFAVLAWALLGEREDDVALTPNPDPR
ncbi:MAG: superinfection immunity protein [Alphaproteobacteria bacterium]|nr:superinfection immunity protein [Alphaproteobacteria bacterium]